MKSAGEILRHAREKKKLTQRDISIQTSIAEKFIQSIEQDSFEILPNDVSAKGFLSLYATAVDIDPQAVIALYRRDVPEKDSDHPQLRSHFFVFGYQRMFRFVTTALVTGLGIGLFLFALIFLARLRQAPPLSIQTPQNEAHSTSPVYLRGVTSSDAIVSIDGQAIGVNQDGVFSKDLDLDPGVHMVTIKAVGRNGKERLSQLVVTVEE